MKTRIISAAVGIVLLLGILLCPYTAVFAAGMAILAALAVWELLHNTGMVKKNGLTVVAMVLAAAETALLYGCEQDGALARFLLENRGEILLAGAVLAGIVCVAFSLRYHNDLSAGNAGYAVFATGYAATGFASLAALRTPGAKGLFLVMLPMIISWMSDTGAYFVGTFLGKHKMAPIISPKKSWEGFFGGWIVSVLSAVLAGWIYQTAVGELIPLWQLAAIAFVCAPLSVCGDLFASVIKRQCGIKDYGNIMPGHGGVMDRFDSVILIAPILYLFVQTL